jgi:hypothetical protein
MLIFSKPKLGQKAEKALLFAVSNKYSITIYILQGSGTKK